MDIQKNWVDRINEDKKYPFDWNVIRKKAIIRDLNGCVICGSKERLEVHHTRDKPILENLITLCHICHTNFANSYCGHKKHIREFNDIRLNKSSNDDEIAKAKEALLNDLNTTIENMNRLRKMVRD